MNIFPKRVFVSGCFDMLHSGHVRFLEMAAAYGEVHVGIGSDRTIIELKGQPPVCPQRERQYMIEALKHVKACYVNSGSGSLDFLAELGRVSPSLFLVNEDGNSPAKARLCKRLGIQYVVLPRTPGESLPVRSTTSLRKECCMPYRLDLAGGWLDQPFLSRNAAGPVLNICIEPTMEFNARSGLASSTRQRAIELWKTDIPVGDRANIARSLFCYENPPGTKEFSGSQDAIGIVFPGLNRLDYRGDYWPAKITSIHDERILTWLERHLHLVALRPRSEGFRLRRNRDFSRLASALATAAELCWQAILERNVNNFGYHCRASFEAQTAIFPSMVNANVRAAINQFADHSLGWKLAGAGGGGYLVLVTNNDLPDAIKIKIRRNGL